MKKSVMRRVHMIISIITVCYNSANTIEETICSVLGQDYPNIEYIVIDGGSNDGTQKIIEKYRDKISVYISERDEGIYDAMNKGIQHAKGEVIGLLNADDLYAAQNVISKIANVFKESSIEACYGDLVYFSQNDPNRVVRYWKSSDYRAGLFSRGWNPPHPTFFVRREYYQRCGVFDTTYSMGNDVELMMRFLEKHHLRVVYLPLLLVKMRLGGVSNRALKNIYIQNKNIFQAAKNLGINISVWGFVWGKMINRMSQFIIRTRKVARHVN